MTRIKPCRIACQRRRAGPFRLAVALLAAAFFELAAAQRLPLIDAHVHYSEDAWEVISPERAVGLLREAGIERALVSSSGDAGTQRLYRLAPKLVVPVLRPYRTMGQQSRWMHDESVIDLLTQKMGRGYYAGIGEFHAEGEQVELPVIRHVIALARRHGKFLHAHVDVDAIERIFARDPQALVLWAHAGFEGPPTIARLMRRYPNLWADLSFREEIAFGEDLDPAWRQLFETFPQRFMLGSDTYTPTRWFYLGEHADWARIWLQGLPRDLAERIAFGNAEALLARTHK